MLKHSVKDYEVVIYTNGEGYVRLESCESIVRFTNPCEGLEKLQAMQTHLTNLVKAKELLCTTPDTQ